MENEKRFKNDEKRMQIAIHILMGELIVLSILNFIDPHLLWKHFEYINFPIHSSIEAIGALAAMLMGFMSIRFLVGIKEPRYVMISLGFMVMGCWDLFHSFLSSGHGFVLTHNLSLLSGGFFFFLIVFNWSEKSRNRKTMLKILLIAIIVVLGLWIKNYRNALPQMIMEHEHEGHIGHASGFTPLANAMNIIAGFLFFISSIKVYIDYLKYKKIGLLLLSFLALITACAGFLFSYSVVWADSWWFWHVLRLIAFVVLMAYMLVQFSIVLSERTSNLKAMKESEEKFRRLFDSEPDAIFLADPTTGILIEVNKAAEKLTKRSSSELVGMHKSKLYPMDKREQISEMFKEIASIGSQKPHEVEIIDSKGIIIPVETLVMKIQINDRQVLIGIFRDISERIKLQEARRKTEAKFSRFVELVPIPLCNIDQVTGEIKYINKTFKSLLGYTEEDLPTINEWWQLVFPDESYRKWAINNWEEAVKSAVLNDTDIQSDTYKVTCKNGEVREIIIGGVLIENDILATFVDITDLKNAERIMLEQQDQLTSMFNGLDDLIYVADPDTYDLLYINDAFERLFGKDNLSRKCYEVLQGKDSPCPFCTNKIILEERPGESYTWELQNEKNHKWYRCFDKGILWSNGKMVRFEMAMDITDIKATEQEIIDEKEMFESTIDSMPGIYYQINMKGNFVRWNQMFKQVSGYNDEEVRGMVALNLFNDNDKDRVARAMEGVFKFGESEVEADFVIKSGEEIPYLFTGRKFVIKGEPFLIGMGLDISNLKTIEKNLRKSNKELEAFNRIAVGREKRMIELKEMINLLSRQLHRDEPYDLSFLHPESGDDKI
ncbi:MAG: PAS domain S-box protein [Candidatus Stygibacter australis]|nr:PAS domain S-box protein [Candidatus Stygibacter australis]MDP8321112.1 PAS domain S-box protein [Candidatus Stygibacter australis]